MVTFKFSKESRAEERTASNSRGRGQGLPGMAYLQEAVIISEEVPDWAGLADPGKERGFHRRHRENPLEHLRESRSTI